MTKVLILGAGVIGVTTAYVLGSRGYEVEVIERQKEPGRETSFANGGQLSYSHAEPWASPWVLPKILKWMFKADAPLVFRPRADLDMIRWGLKFLANCTEQRVRSNSVTLLKLGLYSRKMMDQMRTLSGVEFDNLRDGVLHIFTDPKEFEHAKLQASYQEKLGCAAEICSPERCVTIEPALEHAGMPLLGGIHQPLDESGDIFSFTQKLAKICERDHNTRFHYNMHVTRLEKKDGKISHVVTNRGSFTADRYVMSLGSYSPIFLRGVGVNTPIYPMKGYSITLPASIYSPRISLTDTEHKIVYSKLGNRLRVAGTAEFAGYNTEVKAKRIDAIFRCVQQLFPKCEFTELQSSWACLRPSTPDGPPIIGATKLPNLFLNTGHGTLGWTQAAGSAALLADILDGRDTEVSLDGLTLDRF